MELLVAVSNLRDGDVVPHQRLFAVLMDYTVVLTVTNVIFLESPVHEWNLKEDLVMLSVGCF